MKVLCIVALVSAALVFGCDDGPGDPADVTETTDATEDGASASPAVADTEAAEAVGAAPDAGPLPPHGDAGTGGGGFIKCIDLPCESDSDCPGLCGGCRTWENRCGKT